MTLDSDLQLVPKNVTVPVTFRRTNRDAHRECFVKVMRKYFRIVFPE